MLNRQRLQNIERLLERLDAAVVVRDLGSERAAEQYEGLRKQIGVAAKNHRMHVAHLVSLSDSLERGATLPLINDRINDFLGELGVERLRNVTDEALFEIIDTVESESDGYEVLEDAIVERLESGHVSPIRLGRARKLVGPSPLASNDEYPLAHMNSSEESLVDVPRHEQEITPLWIRVSMAAALVVLGLIVGKLLFDGGDSNRTPVSSTVPVTNSLSSTSTVPATTTTTTITTSSTVIGSTSSTGG